MKKLNPQAYSVKADDEEFHLLRSLNGATGSGSKFRATKAETRTPNLYVWRSSKAKVLTLPLRGLQWTRLYETLIR